MSRQRWIDAGLDVLATEGAPALRIDRLSAQLGLTKGSFFHHFANAAAYHRAVLEAWEERTTEAAGLDGTGTLDLTALASRVGDIVDVRLERAIRAWSLQDASVAEVLRRVDSARLAALESVWSQMLDDPRAAHIAALLPHLLVIGASVTQPPTPAEDLDAVMAMLTTFIPVLTGQAAPPPAAAGSGEA